MRKIIYSTYLKILLITGGKQKENSFGIIFDKLVAQPLHAKPLIVKNISEAIFNLFFYLLNYACMLNQKFKKIFDFFFPAKKSTFSSDHINYTQTGKNKNRKTQLLYHRDISNLRSDDDKREAVQHDWWIN